ncbi:AAA family ATPase [Pseudarthrobacter sp. SL88]|uniref:AAA family ATPase n=1 Tax=Pseudarthrobacter sp. SL88 TaxID=2994666 RepID=UPI0022739E2A|nr:AAA family ATPase [Pseudarthrobacter sp. SL88]MCY1675617.1 AAA family ATPase [Pseudarthrobacter sp. SL88]
MNTKQQVLAFENSMNDLYLEQVDKQSKPLVAGIRQRKKTDFSPLTGRISLEGDKPGQVENYYIGPMHIDQDDLYVISWTAPAAAVFFRNLKSWQSRNVRVQRRFIQKVRTLTNYADVWVGRPNGEAFPTNRPEEKPPTPKSGGKSRWLAGVKAKVGPQPKEAAPASSAPAPSAPTRTDMPLTTMEDLLRETLSAPRSLGLSSVLATLQPEQYDLVTYAADKSVVVQGHAGTGKTIIATHRAAWLVHQDRQDALEHILLLGPTPAWEAHVSTAVGDFGTPGRKILVGSVHGLILEVLGFEPSAVRPRPVDAARVPNGADALVRSAALRARSSHSKGLDALGHFYEDFVTRSHLDGETPAVKEWARGLPATFKGARKDPLMWPLLAYMRILLEPGDVFEHVIVDEAQDLSLFEWRVLEEMNAGSWTLVGDMQQRHSMQVKTWSDITSRLSAARWDERVINDGYRTSQAIADFAAALLPKSAGLRRASPLGRGIPPRIVNAQAIQRTVESIALEQCQRLATDRPEGTVAVITPDVDRVLQEARISGWSAQDRWTWADRDLNRYSFLTPEEARGLEFDSVVVVEPATFRANSGSDGRLYTSLTRANLELVVVHSRPLPTALAREAQRLTLENPFAP